MEKAGLEAVAEALQTAWNAHDAQAFAAPFAEDAEFIHIMGGGGTGRDAIRAGHEALFRSIYADSEVAYRVVRIIELGGGAAVVLLHQRLAFTAGGGRQEIECRPSFVATPQADGGWTIRLFQNTQIAGKGSRGADAAIAAEHPHRS